MDFLTWTLKGHRTWIANSIMSVMPILQMSELTAVMPASWLPWYALGMGLVNLWLRSITNTKMGKRL